MDFYSGSEWININGNFIHERAFIDEDYVEMGRGNVIGPYACIGTRGEMRNTTEFLGKVIIGDNNVISELVTIQRPALEGAVTKVGSGNIIMAHAHIGHDAVIGDDCEICTGTIVGGYATIQDNVKLKLGVTVRNRITVGEGALVGMGSVVVKDIVANSIVKGNPAR